MGNKLRNVTWYLTGTDQGAVEPSGILKFYKNLITFLLEILFVVFLKVHQTSIQRALLKN